ncbi:MAG: mevalonate kinase [Polyangiaceae bacterium]|nr:mevalonate kinase [Polyangiaceae bacterium]
MARACGKVILLGEHAAVYGIPAIACGIARGATATARLAATSRLRLGEAWLTPGDTAEAAAAFAALLAAAPGAAAEVEVELELPPGCGLGSSAAIGVAIVRALARARAAAPDEALVRRAAGAWEQVFHGNASGVDVAAASLGGCLRFSRGEEPRALTLGAPLELAIGVAGPAASTRQMVEAVARLRERRPEPFAKTLEAIRSLVDNATLALEAGDHAALGKLMDANQMLLAGWYVSTAEIERACRAARAAGALGAKLTGAGGGGAVVALAAAGGAAAILAAWRAIGVEGFPAAVGSGGSP